MLYDTSLAGLINVLAFHMAMQERKNGEHRHYHVFTGFFLHTGTFFLIGLLLRIGIPTVNFVFGPEVVVTC